MGYEVSVIVPVYGTEAYLKKCLDSLVNQTLKNIEIIVVNDSSKDHSQDIIDQYVKQYENVKGFIKPNGGLSDTRNYGVKQASGDFIAFVDSDDYVELNALEKMVLQAKTQDLDVVVGDTFMDYPNRSYILKADTGYTDDKLKAYVMAYTNAPARLIKADIMKKLEFKKGIWYEDLDLMPTLVCYTNKIGFSNEAFYHYVQRDESIMNQSAFTQKYGDIFLVLDDVWETFKSHNLEQDYFLELEYLYISHLTRNAVLRLVDFKEAKPMLKKINQIMKEKFPNWSKNPYLKKSSWKFRLISKAGKYGMYPLISLFKKVGG